MTTLQINDEFPDVPVPHLHSRRTDDGEPPDLFSDLRKLAIVFAIVSAAFTLGYNWHEVTQVKDDLRQHIAASEEMNKSFALREVMEQQNRDTQRQLEDIKAMLQQAQRERRREQ